MIAIVIAALTIGKLWAPLIITIFIALISAFGVYELCSNAVEIKNLPACVTACIYSVIMIFLLDKTFMSSFENSQFSNAVSVAPFCLTVCYFLIAVFFVAKKK